MSDIELEIHTAELMAMVEKGKQAILDSVELLATNLRQDHLPREAPVGSTGNLGADWIEETIDPLTRVVRAGNSAFYAHMVAGGTRGHGPSRAKAMTVEGGFANWVAGVPANPFHERAMAAMAGQTDTVLARALASAGVAS